MKKSPRKSRQATAAGVRASRCRNLYRFIRIRFGAEPSDRELARRWGIEWKSFSALKHGQRQVPRIDELERLATVLGVEPALVFEVARGVDAEKVAATLGREDRLRARLERVAAAVFTVDGDGRIHDVSRGLVELTRRSEAELAGASLLDLVRPASAPAALHVVASTARDGRPAQGVDLVF